MKAAEIIKAATAEGLVINLSPGGSLKAIGEQDVVDRWRPLLKQHKAEIINLLATGKPGGAIEATRPTVPTWCNAGCEHFHKLVVPDLGTVLWCCWETDPANWRRLRIDALAGCPMSTRPRRLPSPRKRHITKMCIPMTRIDNEPRHHHHK